ncbi:hypothetical protein [Pedobacter sp.]|jgi:hypothetical protein|uniref:hypothetical protein n=1 Tax=Pedobacter sp. TaxID=1411316 RepID=UPI002B99C62D|nr:hypothetical protein [Pedobacter sp.]HWW39657.1 hypothetical protein [Pedobacter sp.]
MRPKEVYRYYKSSYAFNKETGMSRATLGNWLKWGYVPLKSQVKLQRLTKNDLMAEWHHD